jgi:NAD(P)H-nitrite reductase large subunit
MSAPRVESGDENAVFVSRDISASLKITGVDVFSAGR